MATLDGEEAWTIAAAAAAVLRGHVSLLEGADSSSSMAVTYDGINISILDPRSHAFAQLHPDQSRRSVDFDTYARATQQAFLVWKLLAQGDDYSPRTNWAFWMRVLQEAGVTSQRSLERAQPRDDDKDCLFSCCRLTFQPKDCYDEDLHEPEEALEWINTFLEHFLVPATTNDGLDGTIHRLQSLQRVGLPPTATRLQVVFKVPVLKIHEPTGSILRQHRAFIVNAHDQSSKIQTRFSCAKDSAMFQYLEECVAVLRGTVRVEEFGDIAGTFADGSPLRIKELCIDASDVPNERDLLRAVKSTGIKSMTINVAKASIGSLQRLLSILRYAEAVRTLRVFNAFGGSAGDRQELWKCLLSAVADANVDELCLERTHLEPDDLTSIASTPRGLKALKVQPLAVPNIATAAYLQLVKRLGASLQLLDLTALCLPATDADELVHNCPLLTSLRLGSIVNIESSSLVSLLRAPKCHISSLAVSCSNADAVAMATALSNQSLDVALTCSHLKELRLTVASVDTATCGALVHMLGTNHSLQHVHVKSRSVEEESQVAARFREHDQRHLVRKLPSKHKLAFLAAIKYSNDGALQYFDAGVASEIVRFASHSVHRRVHFG